MKVSVKSYSAKLVPMMLVATAISVACYLDLPTPVQGKTQDVPAYSLRRYFLVASEGLYVVESDGHCSWSYNPTPYQGQGWVEYDDLVYDGWALPNDRFLYATHRYVREVDRKKRTVWEYRVKGTAEVKTCVPIRGGRIAVLDSQEQAIMELESGTGKLLHTIPVPAKGNNHTRYNLLRLTPQGNYLVALRGENRFVELSGAGEVLNSFPVPSLPVMAQRLGDGSTLCSGQFGLIKFDPAGRQTWSFTVADAAPHFPLIIAAGFVELADRRLLVVNSDWHYPKKDDNRVQLFALGPDKAIAWSLPSTAFQPWKRSEVEPRTGFVEHRCMVVQPLSSAMRGN